MTTFAFKRFAEGEAYLALLGVVLLGYALLDKGFAYLGVYPVFVGEIALLIGVVVFLRTGHYIACLATLPATMLSLTMIWVALRAAPFVGEYGFDAVRDSVIVMYSVFAFIVLSLILNAPSRIETMKKRYIFFTWVFVIFSLFMYPLARYFPELIPSLPWRPGVDMVSADPGALATHLAGASVFAMCGFRKSSVFWVAAVIATGVMVSAASRGAFLALIIPIVIAVIFLGKWRELFFSIVFAVALFFAAYILEPLYANNDVAAHSTERAVSARQIADNIGSLFGKGSEQAEGTASWRMDWWRIIINETVFGEYFWSGRGFGVNLADLHGFHKAKPEDTRAPLRSPHNAHFTVLSRGGVPGLLFWLATIGLWIGFVLRRILRARSSGHNDWAKLMLFIMCYLMAILINATFDVVLEGPMQGIWFWSLFGAGLGVGMTYDARYRYSRNSIGEFASSPSAL